MKRPAGAVLQKPSAAFKKPAVQMYPSGGGSHWDVPEERQKLEEAFTAGESEALSEMARFVIGASWDPS